MRERAREKKRERMEQKRRKKKHKPSVSCCWAFLSPSSASVNTPDSLQLVVAANAEAQLTRLRTNLRYTAPCNLPPSNPVSSLSFWLFLSRSLPIHGLMVEFTLQLIKVIASLLEVDPIPLRILFSLLSSLRQMPSLVLYLTSKSE